MITSIIPNKDASIYSVTSSMNAGLDEVLEVQKSIPTSGSTAIFSRSLIQFNLNSLYTGSSVSGSRKFFLKMWATQPENLPPDYTLEINPVSQSWSQGVGRVFNSPYTTEGVSWDYRTGLLASDYWQAVNPIDYGATWYSGSGQTVTESFSYETADVDVDVTSIVEQWIAGSIDNNGFLVHFESSLESDSNNYGTLKFFSLDSNTIYKPRLFAKWDDSTFDTASMHVSGTLTGDDVAVYVKSLKPEYRIDSTERITIVGRDRYPVKTFVTSASQYTDVNYLPTSSYYAIRDVYTGEYVVPFDTTYTKVSYSSTRGNYFLTKFDTLVPNRLYNFEVKVIRDDITQVFSSKEVFKVTR